MYACLAETHPRTHTHTATHTHACPCCLLELERIRSKTGPRFWSQTGATCRLQRRAGKKGKKQRKNKSKIKWVDSIGLILAGMVVQPIIRVTPRRGGQRRGGGSRGGRSEGSSEADWRMSSSKFSRLPRGAWPKTKRPIDFYRPKLPLYMCVCESPVCVCVCTAFDLQLRFDKLASWIFGDCVQGVCLMCQENEFLETI